MKGGHKTQPPFYLNKNQTYYYVRKNMVMRTDGPTSNEISELDTTFDVKEDKYNNQTSVRPISTGKKVKQWYEEHSFEIKKDILIAVITAIITFIFGRLVHDHDIQLTKHEVDIEYLQKSDDKQDVIINQLKDKSTELSTDVRLIEQRIELQSAKEEKNQLGVGTKKK